MRFRLLTVFAVTIAVQTIVWPQSIQDSVDQIRKRYVETDNLIAGKNGSGLYRNEIVTNSGDLPWPAVGTYNVKTTFYYTGNPDGEDSGGYPDTLIKIVADSQSAARSYHYEYLFDTSGALIFAFAKNNEDAPNEIRLYFRQNRVFRIVVDGTTRDNLSAADTGRAKSAQTEAARLKSLFGSAFQTGPAYF